MKEVQSVQSTVEAIDSMIKDLCENSQEGPGSEIEPSRITLVSNLWNVLKKENDYKVLEEVRKCLLQNQDDGKKENNYYEGHVHRDRPFQNVQFVYNVDQNIPCFEKDSCRADKCSAAVAAAAAAASAEGDPESVAKTMANLEEMVEFDKNCNQQLAELLGAEKVLRSQIVTLEGREHAGVMLMKEADEMWISMESAYKDKISNSMLRQKILLSQLRDIETSGIKWRKNKRDLELQLNNLNKTQTEVKSKINVKTKDLRMMNSEISGLQTKIENIRKEAAAVSGALAPKKRMAKADLEKIDEEIKKIEQQIAEEKQKKAAKEKECTDAVQEARINLTQLNKTLLQKRIETENLKSKKDSLTQEIHLLHDTSEACKERCDKKLEHIKKEIARMDKVIGEYQMKCVKCHTGVDTHDVRSRCTECPRCQAGRDCSVIDGDVCTFDPREDCVCEMVKKKLLDNIFENMYTVLDKHSQTRAGKCLADEILSCLSKSRNGKLNESTRKIIQEFVLNAIKKNLDTTIVGGAVKTRCEMEPETYRQLISCLQNIKPKPVPKTDQATDVKKDPCSRWGGSKECNCPKGPKMCACQRAPRPASAPETCPPDDQDLSTIVTCPNKEKPCGVDCAAREPNNIFTDISSWIPEACLESTCAGYGKNVRAAQCVLGLEPLVDLSNEFPRKKSDEFRKKHHEDKKITKKKVCAVKETKETQRGKRRAIKLPPPKSKTISSPCQKEVIVVDNDMFCGGQPKSQTDFEVGPCDCDSVFPNNTTTYSYMSDQRFIPRQQIIEEVLGRCSELPTISKQVKTVRRFGSKNKYRQKKQIAKQEFTTNYALQELVNLKTSVGYYGFENSIEGDVSEESRYATDDITLTSSVKTSSFFTSDKQVKAVIDNFSDCVENLQDNKGCSWNIDSGKEPRCISQQKTFSDRPMAPKCNYDNVYAQTSDTCSCEDEDKVPPLKSDVKVSGSEFESSIVDSAIHQYDSLHIIEIKCTPSGNYGIELGVDVLDELEERATQFPNFPVFISKTNSGHYLLDLEGNNKPPDSIQLLTKKTPSGMIALELLKDDVQKLNLSDDINQSMKESNSVLIDIFRKDIPNITKEVLDRKLMINDDVTYIDCSCSKDQLPKNEEHVMKNKPVLIESDEKCVDCRCSFKDFLDNTNKKNPIPCNIPSQPSLCEKELFGGSANILRENLEEYIRETLLRTQKGIKDIHACKSKCFENAYKNIRFLTQSEVKEDVFENTIDENAKEDFLENSFKNFDEVLQIEVHCANGVTAPVLAYVSKLTSKTTVLDISSINDIGYLSSKHDENPVWLTKTKNGKYKLYIGSPEQDDKEPNSVLQRTPSENVLIVVKNPTLRSISLFEFPEAREQFYEVYLEGIHENTDIPPAVLQLTNSSHYTYVMNKEFIKEHRERLNKLLDSECHVGFQKREDGIVINFDENCTKNAILVKNSLGDIKVIVNTPIDGNVEEQTKFREYLKSVTSLEYEIGGKNKVNQVFALYDIEYRNSERKKEGSLEAPSFKLKRTISGNYTAITDKESNDDLTKSFKRFLKKYIRHAPIKRTLTGEIKILLNVDLNKSSQFAVLKISETGNFYMILDEQSIKKDDNDIVIRFRNEKIKGELIIDDPDELNDFIQINNNIRYFEEHISPYVRLPQIVVQSIKDVWKDESDDDSSFYSIETESLCPESKCKDLQDNILELSYNLCDKILQDLSCDSVNDVKTIFSEGFYSDTCRDSDYYL